MKPTLFVVGLLVAALAGCASASQAGNEPSHRRQANLITLEEIRQAQPGQNAFELVRAMRPNWLQARGAQTLGSPVQVTQSERETTRGEVPLMVYVDGTRAGTTEVLRQILASDLESVRFLGGTEAASRFGADHSRGAILVTTRREK